MFRHLVHFQVIKKNVLAESSHKHTCWGIVIPTGNLSSLGDTIYVLPQSYASTADLLVDKKAILALSEHDINELEQVNSLDVKVLSPVVGNKRVICQGANYRQHMIESGMDPDKQNYNMFFNKSSASICAANDNIIKPKHVSLLDYEIELGLVIGKAIDKQIEINTDNLHHYIGGIVIGNDVSAREVQISQTQFFKGKSYRTFCPVGPYLCLINEVNVEQLSQLNLELKVNDEVRQRDNTKSLVFKPAESLTELSSFSDLDVGDLVLTGTPSGCALQIPSPVIVKLFSLLPERLRWKLFKKIQGKSPKYLKENDKIVARIYSDDNMINLGFQQNAISQIK